MTSRIRYTMDDLLYLMKRLRDPDTGCPWDLQQTWKTIVPYTLEEVYEVVDTIERTDYSHLREELGDLLFQVVFYAQLGDEEQRFDFNAVVDGIVAKLVSRHPHVFPEKTLSSVRSPDGNPREQEIKDNWERSKRSERKDKGHTGLLADIPLALPALTRAQKVQKRAAKAGFDWDDIDGVLEKCREEIDELRVEIAQSRQAKIAEEMGDLLFTWVNLARHLGLDAETVLREATRKFENRFSIMETSAEESGNSFEELAPDEKEALWRQAKVR